LSEVGLFVHGVGADADAVGTDRGEFVAQVAEVASLGCTDR
jgi:hypothetical protein